MSERKKKSHRGKDVTDDNISLVPDLSRSSSENFVNLFLALCEEYDVTPVPKVLPVGNTLSEAANVVTKRRSDHREVPPTRLETLSEENESSVPPLIYVTYEKPTEFSNPEKIECRGHEISICMLDALSMSIDKFRSVTTIRLRNCRINAYGISQIGQIITSIGCVRDLNLDMNPNIRENYHLLCSPAGNLRYLSLKYCNISDWGIEKIANELKYREAEKPQLIVLDLANNRITDLGAEHIAGMLHTNRSLQSLILAGNRITDGGAVAIIRELGICLEGYTQNSNESFNTTVWSLAPKAHSSGKKVLNVATDIAVCNINNGLTHILRIMKALEMDIGLEAYNFCLETDARRIKHAELSLTDAAKEARTSIKSLRKNKEDEHLNREGQLYGLGIADQWYPLTHDEIVSLRRLNLKRLLMKPAGKSRDSILTESRISTASSRRFSSRKISKTQKTRKTGNKNKLTNDKRESSSVDTNLIDTELHPFVAESRRIKGQIMVTGNFQLQHLNLSYNHLTNETLKEMAKCLFYQNYEMLGDPSRGLIHVNLEGNDFQTEGNESLDLLRELLRDRASSREEQTKN